MKRLISKWFGHSTTFLRGGVHLADDRKGRTANLPIERFTPTEVVIPLIQHLGKPATAIVKRKDIVKVGDLIGVSDETGAPIHSSVNGEVKKVALMPHPTLAESEAIVIGVNPEAPAPEWSEVADWRSMSRDAMIQAVASAGIVGLGGAAFPTHRKLLVPSDIHIDTLLLNAAECEPYLTTDHRIMMEHPHEIIDGALLLAKIVGATRIVIGIEDNKPDPIRILSETIVERSPAIPITVTTCNTRYPQGSERQLVEATLGRVVPKGKLPMHVGVVVQNVATAISVWHAIVFNRPLTDRVVTVSGSGIIEAKNLIVPVGTRISDIILACGGMHPDTVKVIAGGPMMGRALGRLDVPITKGIGGLLFFRPADLELDHYDPCISCGKCLDACPIGLEPNMISMYAEAGRALETEPFGTRDCFECGCCAFVCPSHRPLVQFIQGSKTALRTKSALGLAVYPGGRS